MYVVGAVVIMSALYFWHYAPMQDLQEYEAKEKTAKVEVKVFEAENEAILNTEKGIKIEKISDSNGVYTINFSDE